jgi:hypothetical protein
VFVWAFDEVATTAAITPTGTILPTPIRFDLERMIFNRTKLDFTAQGVFREEGDFMTANLEAFRRKRELPFCQ